MNFIDYIFERLQWETYGCCYEIIKWTVIIIVIIILLTFWRILKFYNKLWEIKSNQISDEEHINNVKKAI